MIFKDLTLFLLFLGGGITLPSRIYKKNEALEQAEGQWQFLFVYNLVLHVSGSLGVISMLRKEIM